MKAVAVVSGKSNSVHLADLPKPSVEEIPGGRGVLVKVLRVGVDGTDKEVRKGLGSGGLGGGVRAPPSGLRTPDARRADAPRRGGHRADGVPHTAGTADPGRFPEPRPLVSARRDHRERHRSRIRVTPPASSRVRLAGASAPARLERECGRDPRVLFPSAKVAPDTSREAIASKVVFTSSPFYPSSPAEPASFEIG